MFVSGCEEYVMFINDVFVMDGCEVDIVFFVCIGDVVLFWVMYVIECYIVFFGGGFVEYKCGVGWGVYFVMVVGFDDFDVKVVI